MRGDAGNCGVSADEYSCAHHVTWSPNKLWRSASIFNLWVQLWHSTTLKLHLPFSYALYRHTHRLNMELDLQIGSCVQLYSLTETPQLPPPPSPRIWAHLQGRYWSTKIDDISFVTPCRGHTLQRWIDGRCY
jgi:hypothetical protein